MSSITYTQANAVYLTPLLNCIKNTEYIVAAYEDSPYQKIVELLIYYTKDAASPPLDTDASVQRLLSQRCVVYVKCTHFFPFLKSEEWNARILEENKSTTTQIEKIDVKYKRVDCPENFLYQSIFYQRNLVHATAMKAKLQPNPPQSVRESYI